MVDSKEKLFSEFPPISTQEWMNKITEDLKGADFEKKLIWKTNEGINVRPFYRAEDLEGNKAALSLPGEFPYVRGTKTNNDWLVRQDIEVTDLQAANAKALDILNKGVNSLCFIFSADDLDATGMDTLLKDICPEGTEINFRTCNKNAVKTVKLFADYVKAQGCDASKVKASVNFDPFKAILTKGKETGLNLNETYAELIKVAAELPEIRLFGVNPYLFCNAGANCVQELGYALAWGSEIINIGIDAGLEAASVAKRIKFNFGIGSNYFMEIAKFRAARQFWAQIVNAYLGSKDTNCATKMRVHAQTSEWNLCVYDAHVNLLRTQTESMSAALGGVDSIEICPFDLAYKTPDDFSERIARNQQLLLKEEVHFDKVVDVSAGSYYIETLTQSLATEAWKLLLAIEEKGGFLTAAKEGYIQQEINAMGDKRKAALSSRREILLGTNQYPNLNEVALSKIQTAEPGKRCCTAEPTITVLNFSRGSADFDALRLATEKSGKHPKAFMLTIGQLNMRLARAQFSSNFFACAGYEIIDNLGFKTPEEGVLAAREAGADLIILCSGDNEYAEFAPKTFKAIGKGKELLVVAGAPASMEDLKAAGIKHFINVRSNVLQTLQEFNKLLGIN